MTILNLLSELSESTHLDSCCVSDKYIAGYV